MADEKRKRKSGVEGVKLAKLPDVMRPEEAAIDTFQGRWDVSYRHMRQNTIINAFNKTKPAGSGLAVSMGKAVYQNGHLTVEIPNYTALIEKATRGIATSTKHLLDVLMMEYTSNGHNPDIRIPLDVYMRIFGLNNEKAARRQVNADLDLLYAVSLSYDDSQGRNKSGNYKDMRLCDEKGIFNKIISVHLAQRFAEMLDKCSNMPYPLVLLQLSRSPKEFPHAYYILRRMAEHKYMNAGKKNENIIAIRTLIKACPDLPTEEDVRNSSNRQPTKRIMVPFMRDLDEAFRRLGIENGYNLTYENGRDIPDLTLKNLNYATFIELYVRFDEWPDYPDQTHRIEARKKRVSAKK